LIPACYRHDDHGLMGTLVKPASGQVSFPGDTDLEA